MNTQAPLRADLRTNGNLHIHEVFLTLQGEGPHVGEPAVFVRLAGCNLQCPHCDTQYTGGMLERMNLGTSLDLIQRAHKGICEGLPLIVFTGGEPLRQNLVPLINLLATRKYRMQIETNGTLGIDKHALSDDARFGLEIVCSPKTPKLVESLEEFIVAYKYVIDADHMASDGLPETVLGLTCRPARPHDGYRKKVYLQPADEGDAASNKRNLDAAIHSCMQHGYTLCTQVHKTIGLR